MLVAGAIMVPLQGQADVHNHFSRALAALPAEIFQSREPAAFLNLDALSAVSGTTDFTAAQAHRAVVGLESSTLQAMGRAESKTFETKAGFAPMRWTSSAFMINAPKRPSSGAAAAIFRKG